MYFGLGVLLSAGCADDTSKQKVIRVAVIGGMMHTGLWPEIEKQFEAEHAWKIEVVMIGTRDLLAGAFREGKADLLTMHSGDVTTDLVADGYGRNLRPWTRNEFVILGPPSDPAKIRGLTDGAKALERIAETQSPFVDFQNIGTREMTYNLWKKAGIRPHGPWLMRDESRSSEEVIEFAREKQAYVVLGRIPVINGKMPSDGMEILVEGDPIMRRPFVVMEANPQKSPQANVNGARALADYLLSDKVQNFLMRFGTNSPGGRPLFFPVSR